MATYRQDGDWSHPMTLREVGEVDDVGLQQAVETGGIEPDWAVRRGRSTDAKVVADMANERRAHRGGREHLPPTPVSKSRPENQLIDKIWKRTDWIMLLGFGLMLGSFLYAIVGFANAVLVWAGRALPTTSGGWVDYAVDHMGIGIGVALAGLGLHFIVFLVSCAGIALWRRIKAYCIGFYQGAREEWKNQRKGA